MNHFTTKNRLARVAMTLLVALLTSVTGAWAQSLSGSGTATEPYVINDATDWATFAADVNGGYSYEGETVKLSDLFDNSSSAVTDIVGVNGDNNANKSFKGTFDGNNKTLHVNITDTEAQGAAPFRNISGATIKNLTVTGSVTGTTHAAGLVGFTREGTNTIENCVVNVNVSVPATSDNRHMGGVLGHGVKATVVIRNTVFGGTMSNSGNYAGGMQGWCDGNTLTIENCLFKGSYTGTASNGFHPIAIRNENSTMNYTNNGAYYTASPTLTNSAYIAGAGTMVYATAPANEIYKQLTLVDGNNYYVPCTITGIDASYAYTGSTITVTPTVKDADGTTLTKDTHYTVALTKDGSPVSEVKEMGTYTMTITAKSGSGYAGSWTKDFTVVLAKPTALTFSNVTTTSVTVSWMAPASTVTGYTYQYKKASEEAWSTEATVTGNSVNLTGLEIGTSYNFRVKALVGSIESEYASDNFYTACDAITTFPWTETFEGFIQGDLTHPCWVNEHVEGDGNYVFKIVTNNNGNTTQQLQLPDQTAGTMTMLRLPEMTLSGNHYVFTFDIYRNNNTYSDSFASEGIRVFASSDGNIEGATEMAFIPRQYNVGNSIVPTEDAAGWYTYELPIPMSGTCYIILRGESQYCTATFMDNFVVMKGIPKPTNLTATLTSGNGSIATLTWTETGEATNWVLEYGTAADFTGATSVNVSGTPAYNLTGLTAETTYYARVKASIGGEEESAWSKTLIFTPTDAYTLTVNDGIETNSHVPVYGLYVDDKSYSQFIIPASELAAMQWATINEMTFYGSISGTNPHWDGAQFEVYMAETTETTLSALVDWGTMTKVMNEAHLEISDDKMVVTLDTPYQYLGGNLMIGIKQTVSGKFSGCTWIGVSATGASIGGYGTSISQQDFLPKTTFAYTPGNAPTDPVAITVSANIANAGTVTGAGTYDPGTTATLTATANEGYTFTNWTKKGTVVSTNAEYSFTVSAATAGKYIANFTPNSYTITATADPTEGGIVTVGGNRGNSDNGNELIYDFEDGWQGWTTFQGTTTSPNSWMHNTAYPTSNNDFSTGYGHNSSNGFMLSESYISGSSSGSGTPVTPDNYLVSPQVRLGGSISFYAGARNTDYCAETFSVMVSKTGNTNADDFETVETWTLSLSSAGYTETPYTVDLSDYRGMGYIAIRHHDCNDQWFISIDDITIVEGPDPSTDNGTFNYGETCVVTATPVEGYFFTGWKENGVGVSSDLEYSFTATADRDLVATFTQGDIYLADNSDNSVQIAAANGKQANVTLSDRTLWQDGYWNTLCLPFSLDADEIAASPLVGADIRTLDNAKFNDGTLTLNFTPAVSDGTVNGVDPVTAIEAGKPYIIKWASGTNITDPVFTNVTIDKTTHNVECDLGNEKSITFLGTYDYMSFANEDRSILFLGDNNTLYWPQPDGSNIPSIGACRAYFKLNGLSAGDIATTRLFFGEIETSLSQPLQREGSQAGAWYTLDGRKLDGKPAKKGVYINNGVKVVIK